MTTSTENTNKKALEAFLAAEPATQSLEMLTVDLNGILRGKRIPRAEFETLFAKGLNACGSTPLVNTRGELCDALGYGTRDGDPDLLLRPVAESLAPVPWLRSPTAQVLGSLYEQDGAPVMNDPRHLLANVVARLAADGLHPVVATELEFYLLEASAGEVPRPKLGRIPGTGLKQPGVQYAMMEDLWDHDAFLEDVRRTCEVQGVPATTAHSEFSAGQFEINLHHVDDAVRACDHAVLLKRLIKGVARQHGMGASFMAKPFAGAAGCGLHVHLSLYDDVGDNVFFGAEGSPPISSSMRHALAGMLEAMPESMAIFAPNANSYRRFEPGNYAPLSPRWGYNHRGVSLRIPVSGPNDTRVEHRVAGADANPYLVVASILAGLHHGITHRLEPGPMVREREMLEPEEQRLPARWEAALDLFEAGTVLPEYFGAEFRRIFAAIRRNECEVFHAEISNRDYEWYLRAV